jgi:serine/threonine-protein kinase
MEYVQGCTLARLMKALVKMERALHPALAVWLARQIADGLHAAHELQDREGRLLNVVHRDVSPQNVMISVDGHVKLIDFGVAKARERMQQTQDGALKGKIRYMAPEQLKRGPVDRRADVYAAGVVAWEALTGKRLFEGENEWQIATSIMEGVNEAPSKHHDSVSPELDAVILKALSVNPEERYASAFDMATALEDTVAPATPREVSKWVHEIAKEALVLRSAKLKAIEGMSADMPVAARLSVNDGSEPSFPHTPDSLSLPENSYKHSRPDDETATQATDASVISMAQGPAPAHDARRRRNMVLVAGVVGLLFVFALAGAVVSSSGESSAIATSSATPAASGVLPTTPASAAAAAPLETSAEPPAQASAVAPPPSASAPPVAATARKQAPRPIGAGKLAPWPEKAQKPAQCNPPYYFDKAGVKHLKKECF